MAPAVIILLGISTIATGVFPTISAYYIGKVIDGIPQLIDAGVTSIDQLINQTDFVWVVVTYAIIRSLSYFNKTLFWYLDNRIRKYHLVLFEVKLERTISDIDLQHFENPKMMDNIRKATDNTWKMYQFFSDSMSLVRDGVSTILSAYIVFKLSPLLGAFITVFSLPGILITIKYINLIWAFINGTFENRRKGWWLSNRLRRPNHREESTVTKSNEYVHKITADIWKTLGLEEVGIIRKRFYLDLIDNIMVVIQYAVTPIYLILQVLQNEISIGQFTFYFQKVYDFNNDLFNSISRASQIWDTASYIQFVRNVTEIKPAIVSGKKTIDTSKPPKIEFQNVWFKYPSSKKYVLKNINLTVELGNEIALVGENGAGKTTMIKLLLRFYDPTKGRILVNNIPIQKISLENYYRVFGALFQEFEKFEELTVEQNIVIGDSNKKTNLKKVKEAARLADAEEFITKLDKQYKQILNKQFTGGTKLSTGQWQKIALARMFYRDAPVLILDEPTASIDANAEYRIFKRIFETFKDKTLIIISHRFSTVRNAQKIYVLHEGEIVEEGSHTELMKKKGRYHKAFQLQAKGYTS